MSEAGVVAPWAAQTVDGLGRFLSEQWGSDVSVVLDSVATTGARRRNVLFSADDGSEVHRLVATIVPTAAILIQDFLIEPNVIAVAEAAGVPMAHLIGATADESYVGGPFFVSSRVEGETVPRRVMRLIEAHDLGARLAEQCGSALATLHAIPLSQVPDGLPIEDGDPLGQALVRLDEALATLLQPSPVFSLAMRWLELHRPAPPEHKTIVHADFRIGNVIIGEDGLRAVLDWEVVRTGDPMEDPAWTAMRMWRFGSDALEIGGFATPAALAAAYDAAGGTWDEERFRWWQILGTLRWGVGLAAQAIGHLDGSVPSVVMAASGRRVAEQEYDLLTLIRPRLGAPTSAGA